MYITDGIKELTKQIEIEGYSKSKLAELSGVPLPTVSVILNNKRQPRLDTLKKLIDVLPIEKQKIIWKTINEDGNDQAIIDPLISNHNVSDKIQNKMYELGYSFETFARKCSGIQKNHLYRLVYGFEKLTQKEREIISELLGLKPNMLCYAEEDSDELISEEELEHLFDMTPETKLKGEFRSDFLHILYSLHVYQDLYKGFSLEELRQLNEFILTCKRE